jgi:branched-chain amino acid transport system substrate-binding protein
MRRLALLLAALLITWGVTPVKAADEPYELNAMVSLSGPLALIGKEEADALRAAEVVANRTGGIRGRPLKIVINDVQTNPVIAVQVANQLIAKHVPVIIGPDSTAAAAAIEPLVHSDLVLYCFTPSVHPAAGSYIFSSFISTKDLAVAGVRYLRKRGLTKLAVINSTDTAGVDNLEQVQAAVALPENRGVDLVAIEHFAQSDVNVTAQISRMKAAGAQAVYIQTTGTGFGTALRAMHDIGYDVPVMTNAGNVVTALMNQYSGFLPSQTYFTGGRFLAQDATRRGPVRDAQQLYYGAVREVGGLPLDLGTNIPWDTTWLVISALRKIGPSMTAAQLHDYLENLHGWTGINGAFDFRDGSQRGLTDTAALVVRWDPASKNWIPQ